MRPAGCTGAFNLCYRTCDQTGIRSELIAATDVLFPLLQLNHATC